MESPFIGKAVTLTLEETVSLSYTGEVIADDENGVTLRRPYRKGIRLEFIPRAAVRTMFVTEAKGQHLTRGDAGKFSNQAPEAQATPETQVAPEAPVVPAAKNNDDDLDWED